MMVSKTTYPVLQTGGYAPRITRIAILCFTAACLAVLLNGLRIPSVGLGPPQDITVSLNVANTIQKSGQPIERRARNTSASRNPSKRALTTNDAIRKGSGYLCRMNAVDASNPVYPAQSQFVNFANLGANGWTSQLYALSTHKSIPEIQPALDFYFSESANVPGSTIPRNDQHDRTFINQGGQAMAPTGAWYQNLYNVFDGYIVAESNRSPARSPHPNGLPALQAWSDVVFLEWQNIAAASNQDIQNINYIFQFDITNDDTNGIIDEVLPDGLREWPGDVLSMDDEDGLAILGTPNGNGQAWLLATHKAQLGLKTITSVRVWVVGDEDDEKRVLAFEVEPV